MVKDGGNYSSSSDIRRKMENTGGNLELSCGRGRHDKTAADPPDPSSDSQQTDTTSQLLNNGVISEPILETTMKESENGAGCKKSENILQADGEISKTEMETGNFETSKMETGNFETSKMETGNFETSKMETGNFETSKMETGNFETSKMETGNFETSKMKTGNSSLRDGKMPQPQYKFFLPDDDDDVPENTSEGIQGASREDAMENYLEEIPGNSLGSSNHSQVARNSNPARQIAEENSLGDHLIANPLFERDLSSTVPAIAPDSNFKMVDRPEFTLHGRKHVFTVVPVATSACTPIARPEVANTDVAGRVARSDVTSGIANDVTASGFARNDVTASGIARNDVTASGMGGYDVTASGMRGYDVTASGIPRYDVTASGMRGYDVTASGMRGYDVTASGFARNDVTASGFAGNDVTASGIPRYDVTASGFARNDVTASGFAGYDVTTSGIPRYDVTTSGFARNDVTASGIQRSITVASGVANPDIFTSGVANPDIFTSGVANPDIFTSGFARSRTLASGVANSEVGMQQGRPDRLTSATLTQAEAGSDLSSGMSRPVSVFLPTTPHYHYDTQRGVVGGVVGGRRVPSYNPYHTVTPVCGYNPYHTVAGFVPVHSYQGTDTGVKRIPTHTRRKYGIGSSIPPSLVSIVHPKSSPMSSKASLRGPVGSGGQNSDFRRVSTLPASSTLQGHAGTPQNQGTISSMNQLTIRSVGSVGVDVGSTDGRNMTVVGAVMSPEHLPLLLPAAARIGDSTPTPNPRQIRQTWTNKAQFILACIGYAVGLGNLWRFPYLCYKSGGGAFLIPYFLMLFLCGIPLLLMELAVGQYTRRGPIAALGRLCPLFKGAGVGTVVISFLLCTYYNVIIAWTLYFLVQSFSNHLPWRGCNVSWVTDCFDGYGGNVTSPPGAKSPTEVYFNEIVLEITEGIEEMGGMRVELLLALVAAWILVYFSLWKSIKSSGKVVYFTATAPYLLIGAFLWRALTLPGASLGLQYFFDPKWELLGKAEVWVNAASQNFNSIGIAFGSLIAFSSYNKLDNNIMVDTWAISLTNCLTSLLAGTIVFSTLGNIAYETGRDIDDVVAEGPGLVFVVYPQALSKMPYAGVWAVLFFTMLLVLGLDSQFATVEVIITSLQDAFPKWIKRNLKRHEILVLLVCIVSFLLGLPNIMQGGIYFFQLIDYYAAQVSLMYLAFFEVVSVVWVYGANRLARNVREMTGKLPSLYFRFCWYVLSPLLILAIWVFSMVDYKRPTYNKGQYNYPDWAIGLGWIIACLSIVPIPVCAAIAVYSARGSTVWEKFKNALKSRVEECPCCGQGLDGLDEAQTHATSCKNQVKLVVYNPQPAESETGDEGTKYAKDEERV